MKVKCEITKEVWLIADGDCGPIPEKGLDKAAHFKVYRETDHSSIEIGSFSFHPFPACCGVVISTNSFIKEDTRGSGLSGPFHRLKELTAKALGYSSMVATCQALNFPQIISGSKNRWKLFAPFRNTRTGNDLVYMIKNL